MNLESLVPKLGEWLRVTGAEADVVVSTRIRLARNLADHPFTNRANPHQKSEVETKLRDCVTRLDLASKLEYLDISQLGTIDRQFLVERQLISRELASVMEGPRGVAFDDRESVSLMINEEDQLRLQVMRSGLALDAAWDEIDRNRQHDRIETDLRVPRTVRLFDRLSHERGHRDARQRDAPSTRAGPYQAD